MFAYFQSKKAFTIVELMIAVVIIGVLVTVAVPLVMFVMKNQKIKDCNNQIVIIEGNVLTVMSGMEDNGVMIKTMSMTEGTLSGPSGSKYWIVSSSYSPTIGNMRVGKTENQIDKNQDASDHLKKSYLDNVLFSTLFVYSEVPVCPFDNTKTAGYRIYGDGNVECNCPDCPNCPDYEE